MPIIMTGKRFQEQTVSGPWNTIDTASYSTNNYAVGGIEGSPAGIWFKPDGTKLYLSGISAGEIHEFDVGTAWDITSLSYTSNALSTGSEDGRPYEIQFKADGTKLFMLGNANNYMYEYDLSVPWDITSASYNNNSYDIGNDVASSAYGFFVRDDGNKMWVVDNGSDFIREFDLLTSWDITSTSATGDTYDVGADASEQAPRSTFFKPGGTRYFMTGNGSDAIHEWDLNTDWDVTTSVYNTNSFDVSGQDGFPFSIYFKSDGTKFWMLGFDNNTIYEYNL